VVEQQLVNLLVLFDERMNESSGLGDITAAYAPSAF
jgi:hypothetical protein